MEEPPVFQLSCQGQRWLAVFRAQQIIKKLKKMTESTTQPDISENTPIRNPAKHPKDPNQPTYWEKPENSESLTSRHTAYPSPPHNPDIHTGNPEQIVQHPEKHIPTDESGKTLRDSGKWNSGGLRDSGKWNTDRNYEDPDTVPARRGLWQSGKEKVRDVFDYTKQTAHSIGVTLGIVNPTPEEQARDAEQKSREAEEYHGTEERINEGPKKTYVGEGGVDPIPSTGEKKVE
jgi:hypothetical protein